MARKVYTPEFKETAVRLASRDGVSVEKVAGELGIACWTLRRWMRQGPAADGVSPQTAKSTPDAEADLRRRVRKLEEENRQLRMERDILKKATAFFARERP
jgi:transposase